MATAMIGHITLAIGVPGAADDASVMPSITPFISHIRASGKMLLIADMKTVAVVHPGALLQTNFNDSLKSLNLCLISSFASFALNIFSSKYVSTELSFF